MRLRLYPGYAYCFLVSPFISVIRADTAGSFRCLRSVTYRIKNRWGGGGGSETDTLYKFRKRYWMLFRQRCS